VRPQPGGGELGARLEQALDDKRCDEVALARRLRGDQPLQTQLAKGTQHGIDVALGQRALDEEGFRRGNEGLAGERAANDVNERFRQMGEIAEGFVLDLLADAERAAEPVGSISLAFVAPFSCGYVNGARSRRHELL